MKVVGTAPVRYFPDRRHAVVLYPSAADIPVVAKLFAAKAKREEKDGGEVYVEYELDVALRPRTTKQLATVWALIKIIHIAMNGEPPTHEESYDLYLDLLDLYANKKPNRFNGNLRAVHISEADVEDAARFIEHLMGVIVEFCDLDLPMQADVRKLFWTWESQRGGMERDPLDYDEMGRPLSEAEWRRRHPVSQASGLGGALELAHIVSRGANMLAINEPWNWVMLTYDEHRAIQHQKGWEPFLAQFPHLKPRVLRARQFAGAL